MMQVLSRFDEVCSEFMDNLWKLYTFHALVCSFHAQPDTEADAEAKNEM